MISLKDMMIYLIITTITVVNGQSYRAGVVLYQPIESPEYTADEQLTKNVDNVIKLMKNFRDQVDIFVLPEYALTNINAENESSTDLISSSINNIGKVNDMKCTNDPNLKLDIQVKLACAAKNSAYIVANLIEEDVVLNQFFLTNVAFDREGKICLKCRKQHIINGTHLSPAPDRLPCNFTASIQNQNVLFAVLFGTDLVYALPEASKVNNAIVTSATKNNLPLNYSINMNQAFAIFNGINLIAAEYNNIELNYGGSGIFYSNGSSAIAFNSSNAPNSTKLGGVLISEVPVKPTPTPIVNVEYTIYGQTPKMNMEYINLPALNFTGLKNRHCIMDKRCCSFEASLSADSISPYRWVVLQSKTTILEQETNIFFCGIVAPSANFTAMTFKNISISVDDKLSEIVLDLPATLDENFLPTKYQFNKDARSIMLNRESKIMLFGIMEILGPDKPNTGASTALIVIIVLLILVLVGLLIAFLIWRKRQAKNRRNF